ncbi:MAG: porin [Bacteroidota bacterium]|nr:MAG: porin [Bacteroidota bacterium]
MNKKILSGIFALISITLFAQQRDTLKLSITKIEKSFVTDTVYYFSSRIDTIALQPLKTDTSKVVKDVNPQDLTESKYKIKLLGSIRVNSFYDFNGMTSTEGFLPYDIPVGEQKVEGLSSVYIGARQSRLGLEGTANTKVGSIKTYMEVDFASSTSSFWRLRHAFAEWNYFKIGYTWSTFMDNASLPNTIDFEGPNSSISKRHGLIRYESKFTENSIAGFSIESPQTDYFNPADSLIENKNKQSNFDLAGRYKYIQPWGHVQVAGLFRQISYLHVDKMDKLYGWGLLFSSIFELNEKNKLYGQYSLGEGISHYVVGFSNRLLDAVYNPNVNDMAIKQANGGFVTYIYSLNKKTTFSLTSGLSFIKVYDFEAQDNFSSSQYLAVNGFYYPIETIRLGAEITTGSRINANGQKGSATRISFLGSFSF